MVHKVKDGFVVRKISTQTVAVPTGKLTSDIHGMIALSESGELLWKLLERGADEGQLVDVLLDNYDVTPQTAEDDVLKFLEGLKEQGALEK